MVRLFVGGLASDTTSELLAARFVSFGDVSSCEVIPSKSVGASLDCRGFGYVELVPKDSAALQRCLSLYNGCRWRGGVLKVDIAKPRYTSRLQDIWEAVMEDEAENAAVSADAEAGLLRHVMPARPNATLKLMRKDGRKNMTVDFSKPPGSRHLFPSSRQLPPAWDPIPVPATSRTYQLHQVAPWCAPPWAHSQLPAGEGRHALAEADQPPTWDFRQLNSGHLAPAAENDVEEVPAGDDDAAGSKQSAEMRIEEKQVVHVSVSAPESSDEPEAAVIDFSSDGEGAASARLPGRATLASCTRTDLRLRAFDSDSNEEDEQPTSSVRHAAAADAGMHGSRADAGVAQPLAEPLKRDANPAGPESCNPTSSGGNHGTEALAENGEDDASSVPAFESPERDSPAGGASVAGSQPSSSPAIHCAPSPVESPFVQLEEPRSFSTSSDVEKEARAGASADSLEGISLTPQSLSEASTGSDSESGSLLSSAGDKNKGRHAAEIGHRGNAESCRRLEASSSDEDKHAAPLAGGHESVAAEMSSEDEEEPSLPTTVAGLPELAAVRMVPGLHYSPGLEALKAGAAFWRGTADTEVTESEWQARRSISAADWKAKRKAALKHAPGRNVKPRQRGH